MEMSQGSSLCITILNKQKCLFFPFFYKIGEQEGGTGHALGGGVGPCGRGEEVGKGCGEGEYSANTMYTSM
jgi:hypothetical protein